MIEERLCSREVSKLLGEKGFNIPCNNWYYYYACRIWQPTHQMACDWLMIRGIYICPTYCCFQRHKKYDPPCCKWKPTILSLSSSVPLYPQPLDMYEYFNTFGEAVDFCIKYALENLV